MILVQNWSHLTTKLPLEGRDGSEKKMRKKL